MSLQAIQMYKTTSYELSRDEQTTPVKDPRNVSKKKMTKKNRENKRIESHKKMPKQCVCEKPCYLKISKDKQTEVNNNYWHSDFRGKKNIIRKFVSKELVKSRRNAGNTSPKKTASFKYELTDESGDRHKVCRAFFLNTLGFDKSNAKVVYSSFSKDNTEVMQDKRGTHQRNFSIRNLMKSHIMSFDPQIAHYRREHAPQRLYLPSDMSANKLYENYKETQPVNSHGKYRLYIQMVRELNISFAKLGIEECEVCAIFSAHESASGHNRDDLPNFDECVSCDSWYKHIDKANIARSEYKKDKEKVSDRTFVYAVDLQKVYFICFNDNYHIIYSIYS